MPATLVLAAVSPSANTLDGQGWKQLGELGLALLLSAAIGLERELRRKDAGMRTHTLVGVGSALFMLISKYGFTDVLEHQLVVLDPSRVAAQIVSGIGFIGAGLIFVQRGSVRGLTTAASIWITAAVGAAAGAGLLVLAAVSTGIYFVVTLVFPLVRRRLPSAATSSAALRIRYADGRGVLRRVINEVTRRGFTIDDLAVEPAGDGFGGRQSAGGQDADTPRQVTVTLHVYGRHPVSELIGVLSQLNDVDGVDAQDIDTVDELGRAGRGAGRRAAGAQAGQPGSPRRLRRATTAMSTRATAARKAATPAGTGALTTMSRAAAAAAQMIRPKVASTSRRVSALRAGGAPPMPAVGS